MRAISIKHPGSVDVLEQIEVPVPKPKQGELLIKVHTAAVNRTDIMKRESVSLKPPYPILGVEVAGEVVENKSDIPLLPWDKSIRISQSRWLCRICCDACRSCNPSP